MSYARRFDFAVGDLLFEQGQRTEMNEESIVDVFNGQTSNGEAEDGKQNAASPEDDVQWSLVSKGYCQKGFHRSNGEDDKVPRSELCMVVRFGICCCHKMLTEGYEFLTAWT